MIFIFLDKSDGLTQDHLVDHLLCYTYTICVLFKANLKKVREENYLYRDIDGLKMAEIFVSHLQTL